MRRTLSVLVVVLSGAVAVASQALQTSAPAPPSPGEGRQGGGQAGGRGGGPGRGSTPVPYDDYTGFTKLWDGATFNNWSGETDVWSIDNGAIHADTTKTPGQHHIHYVGPGAVMRDFDLKVEVKLSETGANGGIQYRSRLLHPAHGGSIQDPLGKPLPPGITTMAQAVAANITAAPAPRAGGAGARGGDPAAAARGADPAAAGRRGGVAGGGPAEAVPNPCVGHVGNPAGQAEAGTGRRGSAAPGAIPTGNPWQVSGYQFDLNSANNYTGQLYEGQGRGIVNPPGGIVLLLPGPCSARIGTAAADPAAAVKPHKGLAGEWNQIEIIARGNTLVHIINGQVVTVSIDDNPAMRAHQGILSLQLEGSGQIWYRNVYVKPLN